ncbi:hypothetical protein DFH11DRAFT_1617932 [Phellopilus nigrolimitatus]|nr:hypothetical protein DFH11DRAFT_1617932 [Phellopilus nigrolimitatus]
MLNAQCWCSMLGAGAGCWVLVLNAGGAGAGVAHARPCMHVSCLSVCVCLYLSAALVLSCLVSIWFSEKKNPAKIVCDLTD